MNRELEIQFRPLLDCELMNTQSKGLIGDIQLGCTNCQYQKINASTYGDSQLVYVAITTPSLVYSQRVYEVNQYLFNVAVRVPDVNVYNQMKAMMGQGVTAGPPPTGAGNFNLLQFGTFGTCATPIRNFTNVVTVDINGNSITDLQKTFHSNAAMHAMSSKFSLKRWEGLTSVYNDCCDAYYNFAPPWVNNVPNYVTALLAVTAGPAAVATGSANLGTLAVLYDNKAYYGNASTVASTVAAAAGYDIQQEFLQRQVASRNGVSSQINDFNVFKNNNRSQGIDAFTQNGLPIALAQPVYVDGNQQISQSFIVSFIEPVDHALFQGMDGDDDEFSFYNLTRVTITKNVNPDALNRLFRWSFDSSYFGGLSAQTGLAGVFQPTADGQAISTVRLSGQIPFLVWKTQSMPVARSPKCVIPYYARVRYSQQYSSTINPYTSNGSPVELNLTSLALGQVPEYIMAYVHEIPTQGSSGFLPNKGDVMMSITRAQLTIDNRTQILSTANQWDLFNISKKNGMLGVEWSDWVVNNGRSVLTWIPPSELPGMLSTVATVDDQNTVDPFVSPYQGHSASGDSTRISPWFGAIVEADAQVKANKVRDLNGILPPQGFGSVLLLKLGTSDVPLDMGDAPNLIRNILIQLNLTVMNPSQHAITDYRADVIFFNKNYCLIENGSSHTISGVINSADVNEMWERVRSDQVMLHEAYMSGGSMLGLIKNKLKKHAPRLVHQMKQRVASGGASGGAMRESFDEIFRDASGKKNKKYF